AHSLEQVLRVWLKDPGAMLLYEGQAMAEQKTAEKVTVLMPHNDSVTLYVDLFTHLPIKKTFSYRDPEYRDINTEVEIWGNYRAVQGIMTPFSYTFGRECTPNCSQGIEIIRERFVSNV